MIKKYLGLSLITASMLVMGCSSDDDGPATTTGGDPDPVLITVPATVTLPDPRPDGFVDPTLNIVETAVNDANLSSLVGAVTRVGLETALSDAASTFTVFAPSNAAFDALPTGTVDNLTDEALTDLLQYHVVSGALDADGVAAGVGSSVTMLNGDVLAITADADGNLSIGGAPISATNVYTTNGIVHVIDMVLIPAADPGTTTETTGETTDTTGATTETTGETTGGDPIAAGEQALLDNGNTDYVSAFLPTGGFATQNFTDSPWTIFAPTNAALAGAGITKGQVDNSIYTDSAPLAPAALTDGLTLNMFGGASHAVTNDGTTITVGGFPVTVIYQGTAIIYSIDGIL